MMPLRRFVFFLIPLTLLAFTVAACSDSSRDPLPGERISILDLQSALAPDAIGETDEPLKVPSPWQNEFWPQAGGYPNHAMQHLALNEDGLRLAWSANIGRGSDRRLPLLAQPIVVDGRVFTLDTHSRLTAFSTQDGKELWHTNVRSANESDPVISGGIAFSNAVLYVTNGYKEVLAINPENGKIFWRESIPAPSRAAPTIMENRLFVITLDGRVIAMNALNGAILWEYQGISETAGLVGAASPAANFDIVLPVFSSGEITALRVENGSVAWSDNLSTIRAIGGLASLSDIRGLPVIDKGLIIAISFSGRIVAIDERSGGRVWQREFGGAQTPWVAGNSIFVVTSDSELVALNRDNGLIRWVTQLDKYTRPDRRDGKIIWTGPVLAGGRLIAVSDNGLLAEINPETGEIIRQSDIGQSVTIPPTLADRTLYLLTDRGNLLAYR
ncbi:MAG: PQQ-binding-like beta-propeller repeat protein [Alphaproteobacteria bacterium]